MTSGCLNVLKCVNELKVIYIYIYLFIAPFTLHNKPNDIDSTLVSPFCRKQCSGSLTHFLLLENLDAM